MELCKRIVIAVVVIGSIAGYSQNIHAAQRKRLAKIAVQGKPLSRMYYDLCKAVRENNVAEVLSLIQRDACVHYVDPTAWQTLLMIAANHNSVDVMPVLLQGGADIDTSGAWNMRALHNAAQKGHVGAVRILSAAGAAFIPGKWSALACAINKRHVDVITVLLASTVGMRHTTVQDYIGEFQAIRGNRIDNMPVQIAQLLVISGVDCSDDVVNAMRLNVKIKQTLRDGIANRFRVEQEAGMQDWNAQEVIDFGVLRVIFGDMLDNQITKQDQDAHTHRGAIQRLIAHLADPAQDGSNKSIYENFVLGCVKAKIEINRERRLLAECREYLKVQNVAIRMVQTKHMTSEDYVMAVAQREAESTSEDDCAHIRKRQKR